MARFHCLSQQGNRSLAWPGTFRFPHLRQRQVTATFLRSHPSNPFVSLHVTTERCLFASLQDTQ